MSKHFFIIAALAIRSIAIADDTSASDESSRLPRTVTVSLMAGFASTYQMTLGGTFGPGPDFQNKLTVSLNNAFLAGDSFSVFGWSTTDLPTAVPDWQAGVMYRTRLLQRKRHTLFVSGGVQRWLLPNVKIGAKDWLLAGNLLYGTKVRRVPVFVSEDSYSLLKSTLPTGSVLYTQVYTQHGLWKRERFQLLLRQGPAYTYSWGFYGAEGNRVLRYGGSLVALSGDTTIEAGYRQQCGLQDKIPYNRLWWFALTRQFTR